jgi:serpin B
VSLYYALALAATGANGKTYDEIVKLLGIDDKSELSDQCSNLYRLLYTDNEISRLKIANSLWLDNEIGGQRIKFKKDFMKNAKDKFYSSLFSVDFESEKTPEAMSSWVSENTNGRIAPEFKVDDSQIMSIINTIYFYDEWIDGFNKDNTKPDTFYLENGDSVTCDFMNMTLASHPYTKGDGFIKSSLGLKNNSEMVFILPDEGVSVRSLLSSSEKIEELFARDANKKGGEMVWSVPKFSYSTRFNLKDQLIALGMTSAFSGDADFTGITDGPAFISGVNQETYISIDEKGVEAAAFTEIINYGSGKPEEKAEMILNRPFIYGITAPNGILLFMGVCMNPLK